MAHDIGYNGPTGEYVPPVGYNKSQNNPTASAENPTPTYADISYLNSALAALIAQCTELKNSMEFLLKDFALVVTTDPADKNLAYAHEVLWPTALGAAPQFITYLYYTSLASVNSAAATFVRTAYEKAARGVTGTNAIDLLPLISTTLDEASLIKQFADIHAGDLSDSSQRRTVELLQDWAEGAQQQATNIQNALSNSSNQMLDNSEITSISNNDASNAQAILLVNMNQMNSQLGKDLGVLQKFFTSYQTTFYNNVLGPAMNFRNNVTSSLYPILPGTVGSIVNASTDILNNSLQTVLGDQQRRNNIYINQVQNILGTIQARDAYRNYIVQLSNSGQTVPVGNSGTMITATDTPDQAAYFQAATAPSATPSNPYMAPHSQLSGLDDPGAHPQYISRWGDMMFGNLELAEATDDSPRGALIDGMKPSTHAHTGKDGTVQIHGADILDGSITSASVDTTNTPPTPTGLTVVSQVLDVSAGTPVIDVSFSWNGSDGLLYEVQIAKVV